ncbi:MAG: hypothetical protein H6Q47_233, partial [Deltaproteobacteria bacterium]|nr:hypothetical protein [Deltaproteobacteria bacterium]
MYLFHNQSQENKILDRIQSSPKSIY